MGGMVTIKIIREYLGLPPDTPDTIVDLCFKSAKSKALSAGIPDFQNNKQYDLFLCALTGLYYDNRGMAIEKDVQSLINAYVLELRYAAEDETPETFKLSITGAATVVDSDGNEYADNGNVEVGTVLIITADGVLTVNDTVKTSPDIHTVVGSVTVEVEAGD
jgi:hypothetical protein